MLIRFFVIRCPEGFELRRLEERHAHQINAYWPKKFHDSKTYVSLIIGLIGGWGVFRIADNKLISWAVRTTLGDIGIVQTVGEYQKQGFGSLVVMRISKSIVAEDEHPTTFVPLNHEPSQLFFEKLGFNNEGTENTIELEKLDLSGSAGGSGSSFAYQDESDVESLFEVRHRESAV